MRLLKKSSGRFARRPSLDRAQPRFKPFVDEPALPSIYRGSVGNIIFVFGIIMFAIFVASAYMLATMRTEYPIGSIALAAIWVVGVPIYFFFEHIVLFRKYGDHSQYEQFKRVQELASKIWAGAIVVLTASFTSGLFAK